MRFIPTTAEAIGEEPDWSELYPTKWWLDTERPLPDGDPQKYIAVQTEGDKDPNNFVKVGDMRVLFTDQCEYYFVCNPCFNIHYDQQWSGSTRGSLNWRKEAIEECAQHSNQKGWCEFCDPIFGNGGWYL